MLIAEASLENGFDVIIGYGELGDIDPAYLEDKGFKTFFVPMDRGGTNLIEEFKTLYFLWKLIRKVQPDILHLVTIKPYLYGGIIARLLHVPCVVSAVAGLGSLFVQDKIWAKLLRHILYPIYKFSFNHPNQRVIVQNQEDARSLLNWEVLNFKKICLVRGSGVNLKNFTRFDEPKSVPTVCFAARLLRDKGVYEFVSAARQIKNKGLKARFILAGEIDLKNPSGLNFEEVKKLKEEGLVEILDYQKDIPSLYADSHIICLPSYREGLPKSLAEAAAASRPIVTTDVPGCRDTIIPNKSGLLVPVKNSKKLANALQWLIENQEERIKMGRIGRELAEKEFSIEKIVLEHLNIYQLLLKNR